MSGFVSPTPGDVLYHNFMEPLGLTINELSNRVGISHRTLEDIISNKHQISDITGSKLDHYFCLSSGFFLRLQTHYIQLDRLRRESKEAGEKFLVEKKSKIKKVKQKVYKMVKASTGPVGVKTILDFTVKAVEHLKIAISAHALLLEMLMDNELYIYGSGKLIQVSATAEHLYATCVKRTVSDKQDE